MVDGLDKGENISPSENPEADVNSGNDLTPAELKNKLDEIIKRSNGKDKKIEELIQLNKKYEDAEAIRAKELEEERKANLSTEEQLQELRAKIERQEEVNGYLGLGFTKEQANQIVDTDNKVLKVGLVKSFSSENAVESFKKEHLGNVLDDQPKPKGITDSTEEALKAQGLI